MAVPVLTKPAATHTHNQTNIIQTDVQPGQDITQPVQERVTMESGAEHGCNDNLQGNGGTDDEADPDDEEGGAAESTPQSKSKTRSKITVATLNMRGFHDRRTGQQYDKWWSVNQVLRDERLAIVAIQETHLNQERTEMLNELFKATMWVVASHDPVNPTGARGVAFALNKRLVDTAGARTRVAYDGRAMMLTIPWTRGRKLRILNVYAPNDPGDNRDFWKKLQSDMEKRKVAKPDIVLGDFNLVEDARDRLPPRRDQQDAVECLQTFRLTAGVIDGWREREPTERQFTYLQLSTGSQSRIDRIYMTRTILKHANDWSVRGPGISTDHRLVTVTIVNQEAPHVGKGRWTIPSALLTDKQFLDNLKRLGGALQNDIEALTERSAQRNPQQLYYTFKRELIAMARKRARQAVPKIDRQIKALQEDIAKQLNGPEAEKDDTRTEVAILHDRLLELESRRFGRKRRAVAANDWVKGETICKYWTWLNATPMPSTIIHELAEPQLGGGTTYCRRSEDMARIAKCHYDGLQQDPLRSQEEQAEATAEVLDYVSTPVSTQEKGELARAIRESEIELAIKESANGKAPGLDGIPTEIWKTLLRQQKTDIAKGRPPLNILKVLKAVYNDIEEHGVAQDTNFADGWICPIYKLKKDTREIVNYRPITLLNSDYKIMTRILAMRLAVVAPRIIHPDQAGFVPGHQIFDHIKLNKLIIDYAEAEEINGMIVALDQEKAYDRIDHEYLWEVLRRFNIPNNMINTIRHLYKAARSVAVVNGILSDWFNIIRGVRQGDPLSCLLFDLAIEPLACMLRASSLRGLEIPGVHERLIAKLFADDTTTYLHETDDHSELMRILARWCEASRAKFNSDKTEYIPIGPKAFRTQLIDRTSRANVCTSLPQDAVVIPDGVAIRSLGSWIGNDIDPVAPWTKVIEATEKRLEKWDQRHPTMYGRKLAVGMEVGGRTQFLARAQGMPEKVEKTLTTMISRFVWAGDKHPRISQDMLSRPLAEGGLNVLDIAARNDAIALVWLREYLNLSPSRPLWAFVADALIARAVAAKSRGVDDESKLNVFLQTWEASLRQTAGLPRDLKDMIQKARKYGLVVDAPNPRQDLKSAMPLWYHIGMEEGRRVPNSKSGRCLRERHAVLTVLDCLRVVGRLRDLANGNSARDAQQRDGTRHRPAAACRCASCVEDRSVGCDNPHRCAQMAQKLLNSLKPIWSIGGTPDKDGMTLTASRRRANEDAHRNKERILFDPTIEDCGDLANVFRIFTRSEETGRTQPARRPPRPFQIHAESTEVYTDGSCTGNGAANAIAGSGVWYSADDARNMALRVPGERPTNQIAEIYAVSAAAARTPPFAPLHIVSDSKYVVDGLTTHCNKWEHRGWLGVANSDWIRDALARLRARSAPTTLRWVKGHAGTLGNEEADKLANLGAGKARAEALPPAPLQYIRRGAALRGITQRIAYLGVRHRKRKEERQATVRMLDQVTAALEVQTGIRPTEVKVWKAIRSRDMPRKVRDFWWKALHDALRVGGFWMHIPGYETRAICDACGCEESLEHIMLECDAPGQKTIWSEVRQLLRQAGIDVPLANLGSILGAPAADLTEKLPKSTAGGRRLYKILIVEATHLIWKIRCERVIEHGNDPDRWPSVGELTGRWKATINRRFAMDQILTASRFEKKATPRDRVLQTWGEVL